MQKSRFRQTSAHNLQHYEDVQQIPIDNSRRRCTDILCIIVGLALTITLAVFAIILFSRPQYQKQVFPADTDGFTCGHQYPGYNFVYFAKPDVLENRVCVKSCPTSKSNPVVCKKTKSLDCSFASSLTFYENEQVKSDYGQFCLPKDPNQRKAIQDQLKSHDRDLYYNSVRAILKSLVVVGAAAVIYMLLVQCFPKFMNRAAVIVGIIALIGIAVTIVLYPSTINSLTRWIVFGLAVLLIVILIITFARNWNTWGLNGVLLSFASNFVWQRIYPLLLPFLFLGMGVAFYYFQLLQYRSFWSFGQLKFDPKTDIYHKIKYPTKNIILSAFQIIQIIWGTFFLKEAFNYLVTADAVQWYRNRACGCPNGAFTLVCKHLGSVIACAFMNAFFGLLDFIFDGLIPDFHNDTGCFYCINRFAGFFDLARSDALTVVYSAGTAYCNSARYAEYLANKHNDTQQIQGVSRIYRYCSHFAIGGVVCILAFWILGLKNQVSISAMFVLLLISMGVSTFFISLHADAADAILIIYLMEEQFAKIRHKQSPSSRHQQISRQVNQYLTQKGLVQTSRV